MAKVHYFSKLHVIMCSRTMFFVLLCVHKSVFLQAHLGIEPYTTQVYIFCVLSHQISILSAQNVLHRDEALVTPNNCMNFM